MARKKPDPEAEREAAAANYRRFAEEDAAQRGLRGKKAERWVDSYVEALLLQRDAVFRRLAGEAGPPDAEGWLHAYAPEGPPAMDLSRSGKWLAYCGLAYFEEVWGNLKRATEAGLLGYETKIRNPENPLARGAGSLVACVYTYDSEDLDDVRRVLHALRSNGFPKMRLSYKRDVETFEGRYDEGVALYVSQPSAPLEFEVRGSEPAE